MPQPVDKWFGSIFVAGETVSMELIQFQMRIFLSLFLMFSMPPDWQLPLVCVKSNLFRLFRHYEKKNKTASIGLNYRETVIKIHSKICYFSRFIISASVDRWWMSCRMELFVTFVRLYDGKETEFVTKDVKSEQPLETCSRGERQEASLCTMYIHNIVSFLYV